MKCDVKIVRNNKNPKILVSTPLLPGHKISKITKKTLKRNDIDYIWLSSSSDSNIPTNHIGCMEWYKENIGELQPYIFFLDRDIDLGRHALDRLYDVMINESYRSDRIIGYAYASFKYTGYINHDFPAVPFDGKKLLQSNYISSNSLYSTEVIEKVGLVTDNSYRRLLDWAFLIKCFGQGIIGAPCPKATFKVVSTPDDISSGDNNDYMIKSSRVYEDFIKPLFDKS